MAGQRAPVDVRDVVDNAAAREALDRWLTDVRRPRPEPAPDVGPLEQRLSRLRRELDSRA